jgi:cell division protein FtsI/penicillin-binding protein 2
MGHGIAVTRLQMAMAMAAMANDGWLMRPMLVNRVEDNAGQCHHPVSTPARAPGGQRTAAEQMVRALKTVVGGRHGDYGSADELFTVAGKTGTAQKPGKGGYQRRVSTSPRSSGFFRRRIPRCAFPSCWMSRRMVITAAWWQDHFSPK